MVEAIPRMLCKKERSLKDMVPIFAHKFAWNRNCWVLTKWSIQRGVPALPKSSNSDRIKTTYEGIYDWRLTDEQMKALNGLENGYRSCAPGWKTWEDDVSYAKTAAA
eukprot:1138230-Pelagomonas_calceolata.AAC.6